MDDGASHGLTGRQLAELVRVLRPWAERIDEVIVFGSRAQGTQRPGSDADLALRGHLTRGDLARMEVELAESTLPYEVDLVHLRPDTPPALAAHIRRVGRTLLTRADLLAAAEQAPTDAHT